MTQFIFVIMNHLIFAQQIILKSIYLFSSLFGSEYQEENLMMELLLIHLSSN